ncbi:Nucleic-acid-binding protein from transposon X-element [Eumeta japonica]|uniref:Nucleic-acid-binding protein from transposon X-element n=1 Tax=Eumeta variegata TaxID=151549 RepID=A0A4C1Y8S9_EUMVA|nr:Nucleic-acid-binding protein from transposon X-element [Eumeta japonica]
MRLSLSRILLKERASLIERPSSRARPAGELEKYLADETTKINDKGDTRCVGLTTSTEYFLRRNSSTLRRFEIHHPVNCQSGRLVRCNSSSLVGQLAKVAQSYLTSASAVVKVDGRICGYGLNGREVLSGYVCVSMSFAQTPPREPALRISFTVASEYGLLRWVGKVMNCVSMFRLICCSTRFTIGGRSTTARDAFFFWLDAHEVEIFTDERYPATQPIDRTMWRCYTEFDRGHFPLHDEIREGRPSTANADENVVTVRQIFEENRRITNEEIRGHLRIGDETWICCCMLERKQQSSVWVFEGENNPTKLKQARSVVSIRSCSCESSPSPSVSSGKRSSSALSSNESSEQFDVHSDDTVKGSEDESGTPLTKIVTAGASVNNLKIKNNIPTALLRARPLPLVYLKNKSRWNAVSSECSRLHIHFIKAQNTVHGIKITLNSTDDFRKLNNYLINSNIPCHTFVLEEERKIKIVVKGVPTEIGSDEVKYNFQQQGYSVHAGHRMHRRNGSVLGMVLEILDKSEKAKDIVKNLSKICGLSGITVEVPYRRGMPGQCHRCHLCGHAAANSHAQPLCVKCKVPHWTKECECTKEA